MRNTGRLAMTLTLLVVVAATSAAFAEEGWRFEMTPYFFAPALDADLTVEGVTADADLDFSDILDNFDVLGLSTHVEAWKGDFGLFFSPSWTLLESDFKIQTPGPTIKVDTEYEEVVIDTGVAYRVYETPLFGKEHMRLAVEPLGGIRYHYFKNEIDLSPGPTLGESHDWVEPIVGGRVRLQLTEKVAAVAKADFGGFGIGSASDLTWNLWTGIDYRLTERLSLKLAYRIYDLDYSRGSGRDEFGFDGQMHGPVVGLGIRF